MIIYIQIDSELSNTCMQHWNATAVAYLCYRLRAKKGSKKGGIAASFFFYSLQHIDSKMDARYGCCMRSAVLRTAQQATPICF